MTVPEAAGSGVSSPGPLPDRKGFAPKSVLWRIVREFGLPWRWTYAWSLVFMALNGLLDVGVVFFVKPFVDGLKAGTIPVEQALLLWAVCGIMAYFVTRSITSFLGEYLLFKASMGSVNDARKQVFGHLSSMDLAFFQAHPAGMLMSRVTGDTANLTNMFSKILVCVGRDAPKLIGLVAVTVYLDWRLAFFAYVLMPLAIWPISALGRKVRKIAKRAQSQGAFFGARLVETIRGIRMVKLYGAETLERARVHDLIDTMRKLAFRGERTKTILAPLTETLVGLALGTVVIYGGLGVMDGTMDQGTVVSFLTAIVLAYSPAKGLANLHVDLQGVVASGERLYEVMDARPILQEAPDAKPLVDGPGRVRLNDVSFAYPSEGDSAVQSDMKRPSQGARSAALRHVTLDLEPGQTVALVGPSGGGKSTIINMIARLYDPTSGRVLIDGQDLRGVTLRSVWARMSLVSQDVAIFDDTVRANIAYGCPDVSDEAVYRALRMAGAEDFVSNLPKGIHSQLGERGGSLSGGQRQRISIARAFLKDAPILLLDEPTSALDGETERLVQQAFAALMAGRTTLVIAHRLSTIRNANRIYVVDQGQIVQSGTHEDLASQDGLYARLLAAHELGA